jgi:hypothetical protein
VESRTLSFAAWYTGQKKSKDLTVFSWRNGQIGIAGIIFVIVCSLGVVDLVLAGDAKSKEPAGVVD